ncbi:MAG: hypothetical protein KAJ01_04685 [Candidatus Hydrogenedentes bacterium]|nr:hypothetical protein [Candidatus Hydrogenedentota bacterium]
MNVSRDEARETLSQIEDVRQRTKKMVAYAGGDICFIVWGVIWFVGFLSTHFLGYSRIMWSGIAIGSIWFVLVATGIIISIIVEKRRAAVKSTIGKRIGVFWWLLYAYVYLWIGLLFPFIEVQGRAESVMFWNHFGAIAATIPMFAYVVMGLWLEHFMVWLGLAVTALTILGLFLLQPYFYIWMAVVGGGTLAGTGLFIRNRWK